MMYPHNEVINKLRERSIQLINLVFDGDIRRPDDINIVSFVECQIKVCDDMSQQVSNYKTMCDNRDKTIDSLESEISEHEDIVEDMNRATKYFIVLSVIGGFIAGFMSFPILM